LAKSFLSQFIKGPPQEVSNSKNLSLNLTSLPPFLKGTSLLFRLGIKAKHRCLTLSLFLLKMILTFISLMGYLLWLVVLCQIWAVLLFSHMGFSLLRTTLKCLALLPWTTLTLLAYSLLEKVTFPMQKTEGSTFDQDILNFQTLKIWLILFSQLNPPRREKLRGEGVRVSLTLSTSFYNLSWQLLLVTLGLEFLLVDTSLFFFSCCSVCPNYLYVCYSITLL